MNRNAPGISAPPPQFQKNVDRAIRKTGQLHGDDRRAYAAAQAQGRGKSFMRNFQREAGQNQDFMRQEVQKMGYQPNSPQARQPYRGQPQQPPMLQQPLPGPQPNWGRGPDFNFLGPMPLQPIPRPITGGGQPTEPNFQMGPPSPVEYAPQFQGMTPGQNPQYGFSPPPPGMAYMGGTPNFDESTGSYINGYNPRRY